MDDRVRSLKNLFDNQVCCFSCALQAMHCAGMQVLKFMLANFVSVEQITTDSRVKNQLLQMHPLVRECFEVCRLAVIQCHQRHPIPLLHRRFYQREAINVRCEPKNQSVQLGLFGRGQILQIYRNNEKCDMALSILNNIKKDFAETLERPPPFNDLPNALFDKFISIRIDTGVMTVASPKFNSISFDRYKRENWAALSVDQQGEFIKVTISKVSRLSLIIFDGMMDSRGNFTTMDQCLTIITDAKVNFQDVMVLFVIDYDKFPANQMPSLISRRRVVNYYNTPAINDTVLWIETKDIYPTQFLPDYDENAINNQKKLSKLRSFYDGCI